MAREPEVVLTAVCPACGARWDLDRDDVACRCDPDTVPAWIVEEGDETDA